MEFKMLTFPSAATWFKILWVWPFTTIPIPLAAAHKPWLNSETTIIPLWPVSLRWFHSLQVIHISTIRISIFAPLREFQATLFTWVLILPLLKLKISKSTGYIHSPELQDIAVGLVQAPLEQSIQSMQLALGVQLLSQKLLAYLALTLWTFILLAGLQAI